MRVVLGGSPRPPIPMIQRLATPLLGLLLALLAAPLAQGQGKVQWTPLTPTSADSAEGTSLAIQSDGIVMASGENPATETYSIRFDQVPQGLLGLRLEVLSDTSLYGAGPGRSGNGNFVLTEVQLFEKPKAGEGRAEIGLANPSTTYSQERWPAPHSVDGDPKSGWAISPRTGQDHAIEFEMLQATRRIEDNTLELKLSFGYGQQHSFACFRVLVTSDPGPYFIERGSWNGLQDRINDTIDRGVDWLLAQQELDGSWNHMADAYRNGQTALAVYTLRKSGLRSDHPAIQRGVAFLESKPAVKTYSLGCQMMAIAALDDPSHRAWMEEMTDKMLSWQRGGWGYPNGHEDISNTQYGALGLRAAAKYGIEIPTEAWEELLDHILTLQEESEGAYGSAGFFYTPGGPVTGSRTAAGLGVIAICEQHLGAESRRAHDIARSKRLGLQWMARNFSSRDNSGNSSWLYYYLYGVERVGSLFDVEFFGGSDWYREGAEFFVEKQKDDGKWTGGGGGDQPDACFALLFLNRATAPTSGSRPRRMRTYGGDDPTRPISLRASGDTPLTVWISSYGEETVADYAWEGESVPRVERVEYLLPEVDVIQTALEDPAVWKYVQRAPKDDWTGAEYNDTSWKEGPGAFGGMESTETRVRTTWKRSDLWLRREIELENRPWIEPELWLHFADARLTAPDERPLRPLFEDTEGIATRLSQAGSESTVEIQSNDVFRGESALRVTNGKRQNPSIPGWRFKIRKNPAPGEFRYLHFAWRKEGGESIALGVANSGQWGATSRHYYQGADVEGLEDADRIKQTLPARWQYVIRDLYEDFGGDAVVTGLDLVSVGGDAYFDAIYLGQKRADLKRLPKLDQGRAVEAAADAGPSLQLYLNGAPIYETDRLLGGYGGVSTDVPLEDILRPGKNLLAVHLRNPHEGVVFDLGLRDRDLFGVKVGDATRAPVDPRLAIQGKFDAPGIYEVTARVHVRPPDGSETEYFESDPLEVRVEEVVDPEILGYALDPTRNLLSKVAVAATASSHFNENQSAAQAVDNLQSRAWVCSDVDPEPSLLLEPKRAVKADRILFSHARLDNLLGDAARTHRIRRMEVILNHGRGPTTVLDMRPGDDRKTTWVLPKSTSIRAIEIRILETTAGATSTRQAVGLAEVELQNRR